MKNIQSKALEVQNILGLNTSIVGVKFIFSENEIPEKVEKLQELNISHATIEIETENDNCTDINK